MSWGSISSAKARPFSRKYRARRRCLRRGFARHTVSARRFRSRALEPGLCTDQSCGRWAGRKRRVHPGLPIHCIQHPKWPTLLLHHFQRRGCSFSGRLFSLSLCLYRFDVHRSGLQPKRDLPCIKTRWQGLSTQCRYWQVLDVLPA